MSPRPDGWCPRKCDGARIGKQRFSSDLRGEGSGCTWRIWTAARVPALTETGVWTSYPSAFRAMGQAMEYITTLLESQPLLALLLTIAAGNLVGEVNI